MARGERLSLGAFYRPVMLEANALDVPLIQEEIFGPVLSYGLAAPVFTNDIARSARVVRRVKAGTVWTSGWSVLSDAVEEGGGRSKTKR